MKSLILTSALVFGIAGTASAAPKVTPGPKAKLHIINVVPHQGEVRKSAISIAIRKKWPSARPKVTHTPTDKHKGCHHWRFKYHGVMVRGKSNCGK